MATLQDYLTDAQRLLHDATLAFWSQGELIDYANKARKKTAAETGCTRQIVAAVPLLTDAVSFDFDTIVADRRVIGILDIYLNYSGNMRVPLRYFPYSAFARMPSVAYNSPGTPVMWSQVGRTAHLSPRSSADYTVDFDLCLEPDNLVALTDEDDEILSPHTECVKFYMCYLAKLKDQRRQEAEEFLNDYYRECHSIASSLVIRRLVGA